jgi:uncharacterized protein
MHDFLGQGWAFPVAVDPRGRVAMARHGQDIEQAIVMILLTPLGQRLMRPTFGCRIHELMFAPNDRSTATLACAYVREALVMWEPRIQVLEVQPLPEGLGSERLLLEISYAIKTTNDRRSLVFPFYRIPGED